MKKTDYFFGSLLKKSVCTLLTLCVCSLVAHLFLSTRAEVYANTYAKQCCRPEGKNTLSDFLGFDGDQFVRWLASHEADNYYITTPYLSLPLTNNEPHPNGDSRGGTPGMQCNGFVAHALRQAGANDTMFAPYGAPFASYVYGTNVWINAIAANDIQSFAYDTVDELLRDGKAEKGDIIICSCKDYVCENGVDRFGNKLDGHIGVFWGNSPSDNVYWHSYYYSNGFEQIPQMNQISHIIPKADSDFLLVKLKNKGWVEGIKVSANESITNQNRCYSLKGAVYSIYDDGWDCQNKVSEMITDEKGYMRSGDMPAKTYYIKETSPPCGYSLNPKVYEAVVFGGQTTKLNFDVGGTVADIPKSAQIDVLLKKVDSERNDYDLSELPQGSATLEGAEFEITYFDVEGEGDKTISRSEYDSFLLRHHPIRSWKFVTDKNGCCHLSDSASGDELYVNSEGKFCIPLGTIAIRETQAPTGYINSNEGAVWIRSLTSGGDGETHVVFNPLCGDALVEDEVIRGGVTVEKRDAESNLLTPLGGSSIDGTMFNISLKGNGQNQVKVEDRWIKPGQVVKTLTIKDGKAQSGCVLPYATYVIEEVKEGQGYRLTDGNPREFNIRGQGQIEEFKGDNAFYNEVFRGDLEWIKVENGTNSSYQNPLANVPFVIRSKTTGEEHVVVTDSNGQVKTQSEWNKHSTKTNANDEAVTKSDDGSYFVDETSLDPSAGVWFGQKSSLDTSLVKVTDDEGALPFDEYEIQELSVSANKGYRMVTRTAHIYKDVVKINLGTITNEVEPYGGIRIYKKSSSPTSKSLEGAVFEIYSDPSMTEDFLFKTIVTDENGVARTGATFDVPGNARYWIRETKAPEGYICDEDRVYEAWVVNQQWAQIGSETDDAVVNTLIYGGIKVEKRDAETGEVEPQGGASIDGCEFEIRNNNNYHVYVDEILYAPLDVVKTIKVEDGVAETSDDCLPYGNYEIQEVKAGDGYVLSDGEPREFSIETNGKIDQQFTCEDSFYNEVIKGGVKLVKCFEEDHKRMSEIPFRITSIDTGETYQIVTDKNGEACTESRFLPYGKYKIEEVQVESNKMCKMVSIDEISIYQDNCVVDLGTIRNTKLPDPSIKTKATDASDGDKMLSSENAIVADNVHYENLEVGKQYLMRGVLHLKSEEGEDEGAIEDSRTSVKFTPEEESGTVLVKLEVDTDELAGRELVVFEECLDEEGEVVATDADITYENQTVVVQKIEDEAEPELVEDNHETIIEQSQAETKSIPSTGDKNIFLICLALFVSFLTFYCLKKHKR